MKTSPSAETAPRVGALRNWIAQSRAHGFSCAACLVLNLPLAAAPPEEQGARPPVIEPPSASPSTSVASFATIDAWMESTLERASPAVSCWFVDVGGAWRSERSERTAAIVVARREGATQDRPAHLVLGPVLVNAAALEPPGPHSDESLARRGRMDAGKSLKKLLGLSFMAVSPAARPAASVASIHASILPAHTSLGAPAALPDADLLRVIEFATAATFDPIAARCIPASQSTSSEVELQHLRGAVVAEVAGLTRRGSAMLEMAKQMSSDSSLDPAAIAMEDAADGLARGGEKAFENDVQLLPPPSPLGFVAWTIAVDGQQALKRAKGDVAGADLDLASLVREIRRIGAPHIADLVLARVPVGSTGFTSFTYSERFGTDGWELAAAVARGIDMRHALVQRLHELAFRHAALGGFPADAIEELELRLAMLEAHLPIGWSMSKGDEAQIAEHLAERLSGDARQGVDRVQARTVAWELYAAVWNLSDALPREVVDARNAQRAAFVSEARAALEKLGDPDSIDALVAELRATLDSPFQAALLCPGGASTEAEVLAYLREYADFIPADEAAAMQHRKQRNPAAWSLYITTYAGGMIASMLGPMASDIHTSRLRVVPLIPFADCSTYYSSSLGRPRFPRLIVR